MSINHKQNILDALQKLQKKEIANKEPWKARAYKNAIQSIEAIDIIKTIDDLKDTPGIGKKIHEKIQEILETGKLQQAETYNSNPQYKAINELLRVHAIGPAKAKELVENHNIKSLEDLKKNQHLLNKKQIMGLKYVEDFELRIPRSEMEKHETYIKERVSTISSDLVVEVVGSFRRGALNSGDIDILITGEADLCGVPNLMLRVLTMLDKYIVDTFASGNKKYLGVCKVKHGRHFRRIDILITDQHEFPFAELYFTGDAGFNVEMRNIALAKGYSLSEYGLKYLNGNKKGNFVDDIFTKEEDIFKFLGLEFVEPTNRKSGVLKK